MAMLCNTVLEFTVRLIGVYTTLRHHVGVSLLHVGYADVLVLTCDPSIFMPSGTQLNTKLAEPL